MVTRTEAEREALDLAGIEKKDIVLMTKFSPVPYTEEILSRINVKFDKHKILWMYNKSEGTWSNQAEQYLKTLIRSKLLGDEQQKRTYVDEIIAHIKDITYDPDWEVDNDPNIIAFKNGVFDLDAGEIKPFAPDFRLTNKLEIELDEKCRECPKIDQFFEDSVGSEYKAILYDLFAYCLFRRYPYAKLFFIYGPASTGKSKVIELLERFLGRENYCAVEPQDIQKDIHATAQMQFKLANIVSDINYDAMDNINQVKKITGEDTIKIRNMYKEPYNARIFAKQIFSTNKLPVVKEKTRAWYRRVYTIEFANIVPKGKEDRFLIQKLTSEEELKGLAWKCVEHLKELHKHHFTFTYDINEKEMQTVYEQLSNPILMFADQTCIKDPTKFVYQYEFKDRLKAWLQANHFPIISNSEINAYMNETFTSSNRKSAMGDKTYRVWSGLGWKNLHNPETFNHFNHFNQVGKKVYIYRKCFEEGVKSVKSVKSEVLSTTTDKNSLTNQGLIDSK